jgi:DNA polymerase-3 subunit delta'
VHGSLKIEQFRKLKTTAGFAAQDGRFQLTLIPNADRMTVQAANSILKLLEETPKGWVFILSTNDPTLLLPTLVSRCQILRLKPLAEEDLKNLLHSIEAPHERIDACAQMAQGSWTRAQTYASDEYWEKRKTILQFLKDPPSATLSLMDWASQDPFHFEALLDCLEQFTAELLHLNIQEKLSDNPELNAHAKTLIRSKGNSHAAREFWFERAENLAQARQSIHLPLNRKLQIQNILLPWIGAFS